MAAPPRSLVGCVEVVRPTRDGRRLQRKRRAVSLSSPPGHDGGCGAGCELRRGGSAGEAGRGPRDARGGPNGSAALARARVRLRRKTAVRPPEAVAPAEPPAEAVEQPRGERPAFSEDTADTRERCRFDALRHRVRAWSKERVKTATAEDLGTAGRQRSMRMRNGSSAARRGERGQVIGRCSGVSTPPAAATARARAPHRGAGQGGGKSAGFGGSARP